MLDQKKVVTRKKGQKGFTETTVSKKNRKQPEKSTEAPKKRKYHKRTAAEIALDKAEKELKRRKIAERKKEREALAEKKKVEMAEKKKAKATAAKKETTTIETTTPKKKAPPNHPWSKWKTHDLSNWGLTVWGKLESFAATISHDISKQLNDEKVEKVLLKAAVNQVERAIENKDSTNEEIEVAVTNLKQKNAEHIGYKATQVDIRRDRQVLGDDENPIPILAQHFIVAAFRDEGSQGFPNEFGLALSVKSGGRVGKTHVREALKVGPPHIRLYWDQEMQKLVTASNIQLAGQQPVDKIGGFSYYEYLTGPLYFKFDIIFQPKSKFPSFCFDNREEVQRCLSQCTFRGLGGKRSANFGQWTILKAKYIKYDQPFIIIEGGEDEGSTVSDESRKQSVLKTA